MCNFSQTLFSLSLTRKCRGNSIRDKVESTVEGLFTYLNDKIRDRLVFGIRSQNVRRKLLTVGGHLTLAKAVQICLTYEYAQEQLKTLTPITGTSMGVPTAVANYVE